MVSGNIILQSAGSLSVGVVALLMMVLQTIFFFKRPQSSWYAWSAAISLLTLLYSVGIFFEYNTPEGPFNRFSGLMEFTAIICFIQCMYGFTFSYLKIESTRYHRIAGACHGLILILLWFTPWVVSDRFIVRHLMGLSSPFVEAALGPLGPFFVIYAAMASIGVIIVWVRRSKTDPKNRFIFVVGIGFWILLGLHDALTALGFSTFQYVMEYGFLGFAMVVLWVVFNNYFEIAAEEKYRVITEFANDCILIIQDEKVAFENSACRDLMGKSLSDSMSGDFLDMMSPEDRRGVLDHFNTLTAGDSLPARHAFPIQIAGNERRFVEIASSVIQHRSRPAVLTVMRDITERKQAEEALWESEEKYRQIFETNRALKLIIDPKDGTIIEANEAACNYYGYSKREMMALKITDINVLPPEKTHLEMQKAKDEKRLYFNFSHRLASGDVRDVEVYSGPVNLGDKTVLYSIIHDVTDRMKAEKKIRENEARYRLLFNSANDAIFVHQPDEEGKLGNFIEVNEVACKCMVTQERNSWD